MVTKENSIFFTGGKKIDISGGIDDSSVIIDKKADGSVTIDLKLTISAQNAREIIFNYKELAALPYTSNLVYVEAYDDSGTAKQVALGLSRLLIGYDDKNISEFSFGLRVQKSDKIDHSSF